jgi:TPP-dependent pyruvate/acetoin dehydrogenase alpha subunit
MQLSRDELKRAYRRMFTIRVFEERVEKEFAAGNIPGFAHVYLGQEASASGFATTWRTTTTSVRPTGGMGTASPRASTSGA